MSKFLLALLLWVLPGSAFAQTVVYVVRHAEKVQPGKDPVLTTQGESRAKALAHQLASVPLAAIYSTKYQRNLRTAAPAAAQHKLTPRIVEPHAVEALAKRVRAEHQDQHVLVVGHSNTVPKLLKAFGIGNGEDLEHWMYDDLFVVILNEKPGSQKLVHLHYGARSFKTR